MSLGKIGILSLGDMGAGVARILAANGFQTISNCTGRRYIYFPLFHPPTSSSPLPSLTLLQAKTP